MSIIGFVLFVCVAVSSVYLILSQRGTQRRFDREAARADVALARAQLTAAEFDRELKN